MDEVPWYRAFVELSRHPVRAPELPESMLARLASYFDNVIVPNPQQLSISAYSLQVNPNLQNELLLEFPLWPRFVPIGITSLLANLSNQAPLQKLILATGAPVTPDWPSGVFAWCTNPLMNLIQHSAALSVISTVLDLGADPTTATFRNEKVSCITEALHTASLPVVKCLLRVERLIHWAEKLQTSAGAILNNFWRKDPALYYVVSSRRNSPNTVAILEWIWHDFRDELLAKTGFDLREEYMHPTSSSELTTPYAFAASTAAAQWMLEQRIPIPELTPFTFFLKYLRYNGKTEDIFTYFWARQFFELEMRVPPLGSALAPVLARMVIHAEVDAGIDRFSEILASCSVRALESRQIFDCLFDKEKIHLLERLEGAIVSWLQSAFKTGLSPQEVEYLSNIAEDFADELEKFRRLKEALKRIVESEDQ